MVNFPNYNNQNADQMELMLDSVLNSGILEYIGETGKLAKHIFRLRGQPFPQTEDTLKGCDALAHAGQLQEILDLPVAEVNVTAYNCGCVLGLLGFKDIIGALCNDHILRLSGIKDEADISVNVIKECRRTVLTKWMSRYRDHHIENHGEDPDRIDELLEQTRHDTQAQKLLDLLGEEI